MIEVIPVPIIRDEVQDRAEHLNERVTRELEGFVRERIPETMENMEFAAMAGALMVALSRQLASCAAAFAETHQVDPQAVKTIIHGQLARNFEIAVDALRAERSVQ